MLDNIPESMIEQTIKELKSVNIPLYIWGGAKLAQKIKQYFEKKEIRIDGFLISRDYWDNDTKSLYGYPAYVLEDYLSKNKCNLVVAFAGYKEGMIEKYSNNIQRLYVIDYIGILCMENFDSSISIEFYKKNEKQLEWLEKHLYDEKSKEALKAYIFQRISGEYVKAHYELNQYFPDDIIHLHEEEVFLDCGSYHGESTIDFIMQLQNQGVNNYKQIVCIEADKANVLELKKTLEKYEKIQIISAGVWDSDGTLCINAGHGQTSQICVDGNESIYVKTIDSIMKGEEVTYIKMDIEGSELKALCGAEKTIKDYKPKLAICIYHKPEDLIEIPQYIYKLRNDYKFYIRNHSQHGIETVLYAV